MELDYESFLGMAEDSADSSAKSRHRRIAGGSPTDFNRHSYIVSIRSSDTWEFFCAGTIISEKVILTAGHCTIYSPETICVSLGKPHQNVLPDHPCFEIGSIKLHPDYYLPDGLSDAINDIALIILKESLPLSKKVRHVNLIESNHNIAIGSKVTAYGRGAIREPTKNDLTYERSDYLTSDFFRFDNGTQNRARVFPKYLQRVDLEVLSIKECEKKYEHEVHKSHICAYAPGKGSCFKDSGGPLMADGFQVGIFSGGRRCAAHPGYPGLYTNVSMFRSWIDDEMKALSLVLTGRRESKLVTNKKNRNITKIGGRWRSNVNYRSKQPRSSRNTSHENNEH
ncbi:hypothetical protein QAD02_008993 [Eretmocerus hayati]|uniref:Uncharacterized protein n=1 Tax=Eretmocerus hayati TaxID=131215 RepID=A0ACC2N9H5_9HYME|nr:hypothetical protein QAD02_008993 [Eretmocerus hayati]